LGGDCCTTNSPQGRVLLSAPFAKNYGVMVRLSGGAAYEHSRCRLGLQLFIFINYDCLIRTAIRTYGPNPQHRILAFPSDDRTMEFWGSNTLCAERSCV
jgi:hypothetical protein